MRLTPLTPVPPAAVRRVLLIEDIEPDAALVRACLRRWNEEVSMEWADSITGGIEMLESEKDFDVILLDLRLPETSGLEALDEILPRVTTVPVVVLTGTDDERLAAAALRAGAQDYLLKDNLTPQHLGRTLRHAIDRARMVRDLALEEERSRQLIWTSRYGIFRANAAGEFTEANPALSRMLGYSEPSQLLGQRAIFVVDDEELTLESPGLEDREVQVRRSDGSLALLQLQARAIVDRATGESGWEGFLNDVTETRRLESEFRQTEKMRTLGQFAAGVAHDLNNVFTVVLGGVDEIGDGLPDDSPLQEEVPVILDAVHRGAHLVRKILSFSRRDRLTPVVFDLGELIRSRESSLRELVRPGIEIVIRASGDVPAWGDTPAMVQILSNLVSNAGHATSEGDRIEVSAEREVRDETTWAVLMVHDTGSGMSGKVQERIFEPFYSTGDRGSGNGLGLGMGLGLAMVHGMIEQQGGLIEVDSEVGTGTIFRILLPSARPPDLDAGIAPEPEQKRGRTILMVEDEAGIRRAGARGLERAGYTVLQAADGTEGIELYREHRDQIGLIISDVMMPVLNGRVMIDRLKEMDPGLRYLFTSGYSGLDLTRRDLLAPGEPLLSKPWSIDELLDEVEQWLPLTDG